MINSVGAYESSNFKKPSVIAEVVTESVALKVSYLKSASYLLVLGEDLLSEARGTYPRCSLRCTPKLIAD